MIEDKLYDKRFSKFDVAFLKHNDIPPEIANAFDKRFNVDDISSLNKRVDPKFANALQRDTHDILHFSFSEFTPAQCNAFDKRFDYMEIENFIKFNIPAEKANAFASKWGADEIIHFIKANISSEVASKYPNRFRSADIVHLHNANISTEQFESYSHRFSGFAISKFIQEQISPEQASSYDIRFSGWEIIKLIREQISPEQASSYNSIFEADDIISFIQQNTQPEKTEYPLEYQRHEKHLIRWGVYPDLIKKYPHSSIHDFYELRREPIDPKEFKSTYRYKIYDVLRNKFGRDSIPSSILNAYKRREDPHNNFKDLYNNGICTKIANAYDDRFDYGDVIKLFHNNILPEKANEFDTDFSVDDIIKVTTSNLDLTKMEKYSPRWSKSYLVDIIMEGLKPEELVDIDGYNNRFDIRDILSMIKREISPVDADNYSKRFSGREIIELYDANISSTDADKFHSRFKADKIILFNSLDISSEIANSFPENYRGISIAELYINYQLIPEDVSMYPESFDGWEVLQMLKGNISAERIKQYPAHFNARAILLANEFNITPIQAKKCDSSTDAIDWIFLQRREVPQKLIEEYNFPYELQFSTFLPQSGVSPSHMGDFGKRFQDIDPVADEICALIRAGISPEQAELYPRRFDGRQIAELYEAGLTAEMADVWDPMFSSSDIITYHTNNITSNQALFFPQRFYAREIVEFIKNDIEVNIAAQYHPKFYHEGIIELQKNKISPEQANNYNDRFNESQVLTLARAGISPESADAYPKILSGHVIASIHKAGLNPYNLSKKQMQVLQFVIEDMVRMKEFQNESSKFQLIGTGSASVVLQQEDFAWKFSQHIEEEMRLLKMLENPKYVVKAIGEVQANIALQLEYISGKTLESIIKNRPIGDKNQIIHYSQNVFDGLKELKEANIYHRDIRPSNIMINDTKNQAVIIDLGIAVRGFNNSTKDNRRYGGTDLMSLGQLMYKMATGNNLFNEHIGEETHNLSLEWADEIEQLRNDFCDDKKTRVYYLKKVNDNILDKRIRSIIRTCLRAGYREQQDKTSEEIREKAYNTVQKVFERY